MVDPFAAYAPTKYPYCLNGYRRQTEGPRETEKLSQGDIEKRTGLLRCYISRVEKGHTVPSVDTLEKMARALEVPIPMYRIFTDEAKVEKPDVSFVTVESTRNTKQEAKLRPLVKPSSRLTDNDQRLLLHMASKMPNGA
jgi:transcriptional regulator with XRE-family HTH domain